LRPVLLVIQLGQMFGLALLLSAIGVYLRDLKDLVQVAMLLSMYLLPVFYLPSMVPALLRPLLYVNPFSYLIWCYQDAFYFGRFEHPWAWLVASVLSVTWFIAGWVVFARLKPMFGNAL
jgi:lipopolysaccharide transport system permease protein